MSDIVHLIDGKDRIWMWQGTTAPGAPGTTSHVEPFKKSWAKGCNLLSVWMVGAGASGGNGFTKGSAGAAGGGGGGGGGGGWVQALFNMNTLPDTLWIAAPAGAAGFPGGRAYVACRAVIIDDFIRSGNGDASVGNAGTGSANGSGGSGSTVATNSTGSLLNATIMWHAGAGALGGGGGNHTGSAGTNGSSNSNYFVGHGGGGGGGSQSADFAGGNGGAKTQSSESFQYSIGLLPTAPLGGTAGPNNGNPGRSYFRQYGLPAYMSYGGAGGGSTNTDGLSGGNGGIGGFGCGGGGGGAGVLAGGLGAAGGDALVVITCW